jgi:hypothetical protein
MNEVTKSYEQRREQYYPLGAQNLLAQIREHADIVQKGSQIVEAAPNTPLIEYLLERSWRRAKQEKIDEAKLPAQVQAWIYDHLLSMMDAAIQAQIESQGGNRAVFIYDPTDLPPLEELTHSSP